MTQFYSRVDTEFNGDVYNIPFSYSKESEISVYLDDELFTDWYFLNESQIKFTELPSKTPEIVTIIRTTDITKKVVEYTNNTMLSKEALNLSQDQLLNAVQEIYDNNIQFEINTEENILHNRTEIDAQVEANRQELLHKVEENKTETDKTISDFKAEVNTTIEQVSEAASKINELESAVNTAVTAANTATTKADEVEQSLVNAQTSIDNALSEATEAVNNATEQANIAAQKAQEIIDFNPAKVDLSNLTEEGLKVIKDNSGSGLEVCDIGLALYVDETKGLRRYLNGQIVDINTNTQAFLNRLLQIQTTNPDYFTTEDNWQAEALLNIDGCVYKFVLNYADDGETVVSVRLPKYPDYIEVSVLKLKLRYFIQIATGSETENNIINDIELNNPYSLFDSKYSDHELNNLSWLKSEGQWNAKAVYTDAYDKLLKVYNGTETVEGLSVKLSTEDYTDYDFVLNTEDETFRLPLLDGSESLPSETTITQTFGTDFNLPYNAFVAVSAYSSDVNSDGILKVILPDDTVTHTIWQHDSGYNTYTSPLMPKGTKVITSGGTSYTWVGYYKAQGNGTLYYYIGETVQNANLIDAGRIGEQLANKQDKCIHITETYQNGTSWYRVYSDGWCEQGGRTTASRGVATITFLKPYKDTNYTYISAPYGTVGNQAFWIGVTEITATGFKPQWHGASSSATSVSWSTEGYIK